MYQDSPYLAVTREQIEKIELSPKNQWMNETQGLIVAGFKAVVYANRGYAGLEDGDLVLKFKTVAEAAKVVGDNAYLSIHTVH